MTTTTTTTFRAGYWVAADGQSDVLLTRYEDRDASNAELLALAHAEAEKVGLRIGDGQIVVGDWKGPAIVGSDDHI